jgi:16S rRNA processing protein RimM
METPEAPSAEAKPKDRIVVLGRIAGLFGVKGWVKIQSYTDPPENLLDYPVWQLNQRGSWTEARWAEGRPANRMVLGRLENVNDRDQAQAMVGADIGVWRSELPPPAPGEYYWEDLTGLDAYSPSGQWLGKVDHFRETAVHPLMVISGAGEHLVPLVKQRLLAVDLAAGRMTVDWDPDW